MATKRKATTRVKEAAPAYTARSMGLVFFRAFAELTPMDRAVFYARLLEDNELREDLLDSIVAVEGRGEPGIDFDDYLKEVRRDGLL